MGGRTKDASVASLASFLRRGLVNDGDIEELFERLMRVFHASGVMLIDGFDGFRPGGYLTRDVPDSWMRHHERLAHEDPSRPIVETAPAGTWFCAQRDMGAPEWRREVSVHFRDEGFRDLALVRLYNPFRDNLLLGVYRSDRRFDKRALQTLELIYPHLAGASATRRALSMLEGNAKEPAPAFFISFPGPVVVLDRAVRAIIERHVGLVSGPGWGRIERALVSAASKFAFAQSGGRSQVLWRSLRVDFATVPPRPGEKMRLAGFLVEDAGEVGVDEAPAFVQSLLSPRQLTVARHFASGMDVPTIAEALRIGEETARSHLRAAYRKLRISSRAELARALTLH